MRVCNEREGTTKSKLSAHLNFSSEIEFEISILSHIIQIISTRTPEKGDQKHLDIDSSNEMLENLTKTCLKINTLSLQI